MTATSVNRDRVEEDHPIRVGEIERRLDSKPGTVVSDICDDHFELSRSLVSSSETPLIFHLRDLPFFDRETEGSVRNGLAADYWLISQTHLLVSGWVIGEQFSNLIQTQLNTKVCTFIRPDVEIAFPHLRATCAGILAVIPINGEIFQFCGINFRLPEQSSTEPEVFWSDHKSRLGFLLEFAHFTNEMLIELAASLPVASPTNQRARGHLEQAKGVVGHGGLVTGWTVTLPGVKLALIDAHGQMEWLDQPIRWHREDIVNAFASEFGNFSFNAGLLQAWRHALDLGEKIRLIAIDGNASYVLSSLNWDAAPIEPSSFARWAFDLPTPLDQFYKRLDHHDGAILETLIIERLRLRFNAAPDVKVHGSPRPNPRCSVIVPLYGRFDFLLNQLLELSEDNQFKEEAELIYVVDDPRILAEVHQQAWLLYEAYRVPFKIVSNAENRGYSGANNLGVSISRAPFILFLNSDVIPIESGWLAKMLSAFDEEEDVGIIGARLFYPNGSIQHNGMSFAWHPELAAHVNKHPGSGMEAKSTSSKPTPRPAVTGACMMVRKTTYDAVGGLDETFLIGDFEDSDFCLKVRQSGKSILCVEDVNLVHLERQSLVGIGEGRFRDLVVRYNAWKHERKWGAILRSAKEQTP